MSLFDDIQYQFSQACQIGNVEAVKHIIELGLTMQPSLDIHENEEAGFRICCKNGFIELAKFIYEQALLYDLPIDIKAMDSDAIVSSCSNNHLATVKWLYELSIEENNPFNLHHNNNYMFIQAVVDNNLELAEWILTKTEYSSNVYDHIFNRCVYKDNFKTIIWLLDISKKKGIVVDIHYWQDYPFRSGCCKGDIEVVKALVEYGDYTGEIVNINGAGDEAFKKACQYNFIDIVEYLLKLSPNYNFQIEHNSVVSYEIIDEYSVIKNMLLCGDNNKILKYFEYCSSKIINDDVQCEICYVQSEDMMVELMCGHIFCLKCLIEDGLINKNRKRKCSICEKYFRWKQMILLESEFVIHI
jgi:hypothetical protein